MKGPEETPYERAAVVVCLGVSLIVVGVVMAFLSPDLGEPLGRAGVPAWAVIGLLWISGAGALVAGVVALVRGARP